MRSLAQRVHTTRTRGQPGAHAARKCHYRDSGDRAVSRPLPQLPGVRERQWRAQLAPPRSGPARTLLRDAMARGLHFADPHLALEAARYQATLGDDATVTSIVTESLTRATTDPGYLELEIWHLGPYRRELAARTAAGNRAGRRPTKGLRKAASIELRPAGAAHNYRYQLHDDQHR
jgi:hypothetical protein